MIREKFKEDKEFRSKLRQWFAEQGWTFFGKDEDYEKVSRQYVYLLINKIMFYNILKTKNKELLPNIIIPSNIKSGEQFRKILQSYFDKAIKIDYETIFATNFLDAIPIPDELTEQLSRFIEKISSYDYSRVGYEILGRVFERLIPERERHTLGQYFTRSDIVDLIVGFCVRNADDKVLDGACGAGTFLVRSYVRKLLLNPSKKHEELIDDLYGIDIAKFPAHLATINLVARNLSSEKNYPKVITRDFFDVKGKEKIQLLNEEYAEQYSTLGLDLEKFSIEIPECDAVVMNPPYTRQEEMEEGVFSEGYRTKLQKLVEQEWNKFYIGKRSSIYSYFFIHGAKFLKEHGRLGLITSNSWLDVDYGKYLQEFFLRNFKVVAIIESKVERWFEDADINTVITILEKCNDKEERESNLVKFVQLKKPLSYHIPSTNSEHERWKYVEDLIDKIEKTNKYYEGDELRIFVKKQKELWEEGYNEEDEVYEGSKWGKYLRAPEIFFKILEKGKDIFVPLREIAEVRRGFTTGANEFFYLTEDEIKKWGIEKEFWMHKENGNWIPNYIIKSPRECKGILINPKDLKYRVLMIHKDKNELRGTNVLKYIEWGEKQGFHKRPTCASRQRWYELTEIRGDLCCMMSLNDRHLFWYNPSNCLFDARLYGITLKKKDFEKVVGGILNSTIYALFVELWGRLNLGQGALDVKVYEYAQIPVINPLRINSSKKLSIEESLLKLSVRNVDSIFKEIGATRSEEVSLDKVKPDRRELDKIIMEEILGLTEDEQLEVYRAVVDLVKSRVEKAKSVPKKSKKVKGLDVEALVNDVISEVGKLKRFPEDFINFEKIKYRKVSIPKGKTEIKQDIHGFYVEVEKKKIRCGSLHEAKYIQYSSLSGKTVIKIPEDENLILKVVNEYEPILKETLKKVDEYLNSTIADGKLRSRVKDEVMLRITG